MDHIGYISGKVIGNYSELAFHFFFGERFAGNLLECEIHIFRFDDDFKPVQPAILAARTFDTKKQVVADPFQLVTVGYDLISRGVATP